MTDQAVNYYGEPAGQGLGGVPPRVLDPYRSREPVSSGRADQVPLGELLDAGESNLRRSEISVVNLPFISGDLRLVFFTARRTELVGRIRVMGGSTAAGATPSLARFGFYGVDEAGDLTLLGATPNDTTLFASAGTRYTRQLSDSVMKYQGQRYAIGVIIVTEAATPTFAGTLNSGQGNLENREPPARTGRRAGQTDLPAEVAGSVLTTSGGIFYAAAFR